LKRAVLELKDQGIEIAEIKYTKPVKSNQNYSREMVVRIDSNKNNSVTVIAALFPELKHVPDSEGRFF